MEVSRQFRWELPRLGGVKLGLAELMWCTEVSLAFAEVVATAMTSIDAPCIAVKRKLQKMRKTTDTSRRGPPAMPTEWG